VLEQTILKQKRLARIKNNDLRKKVLLKRTFELVCEIMDHENGFDFDENETINNQKTKNDQIDQTDQMIPINGYDDDKHDFSLVFTSNPSNSYYYSGDYNLNEQNDIVPIHVDGYLESKSHTETEYFKNDQQLICLDSLTCYYNSSFKRKHHEEDEIRVKRNKYTVVN